MAAPTSPVDEPDAPLHAGQDEQGQRARQPEPSGPVTAQPEPSTGQHVGTIRQPPASPEANATPPTVDIPSTQPEASTGQGAGMLRQRTVAPESSPTAPTVDLSSTQRSGTELGDTRQPTGRPSLGMLADAPLTDDQHDRLDFQAYADALAGLLDHPDTDTPLTIAINAPWGAGKTSLTNMVTQRLVERPLERGDRSHIICWFNAWLHDDAPHLGAAFAAEVAKTANRCRVWPRRLLSPLPSAMLSPEERWRRRILIGLGSLAVAAALVALMPSVRGAVKPNASTVETIRAVAGQRWTSLALIGLVILTISRKLFAAAQAAARFVDDPKSEAAKGSMSQVHDQLGRLIRQAARNPGRFGAWLKKTFPRAAKLVPRYRRERRRLVLIVDDLAPGRGDHPRGRYEHGIGVRGDQVRSARDHAHSGQRSRSRRPTANHEQRRLWPSVSPKDGADPVRSAPSQHREPARHARQAVGSTAWICG